MHCICTSECFIQWKGNLKNCIFKKPQNCVCIIKRQHIKERGKKGVQEVGWGGKHQYRFSYAQMNYVKFFI